MKKSLISMLVHLACNAIGLLLAVLLLPGFRIDPLSFIIVVVLFSVILVVAQPIMRKVSQKWVPQLMGGLSLVVVFLGLGLTDLIVSDGMAIGGIANWLAGTLLVWLGALIASIALPSVLGQPKSAKKA
ncbi:MAG: hypothetical protein AAGK37_17860 [Pseudomonadota bacterium]